jgi:hypothetical protein
MDLRVGGGKYKLIKKLGSGAFGEIYQGKYLLGAKRAHRSGDQNWGGGGHQAGKCITKVSPRRHILSFLVIICVDHLGCYRSPPRPSSLSCSMRQSSIRSWQAQVKTTKFNTCRWYPLGHLVRRGGRLQCHGDGAAGALS